tara:strand:+ start:140 stop:613 length:474 start_codon:yes stop_codon:yes gene_type:complete
MRIGFGYDVHKLIKDTSMLLGGIKIPSKFSIKAHSDGDIILHACADAILGALSLGDIGEHFPDSDFSNKNIDSALIIKKILEEMNKLNYEINNIDITLVAQEPKLANHKSKIMENLSVIFSLDSNALNLKATTTEGLGYIGTSQGIACYAVVILKKI